MIYSNLYEYDFKSCFFNILKNIDYDLSNVNKEDKKIRNIDLGLIQKDNVFLKSFLSSKIKDLLSIYIEENKLTDNDIIWRQKDGLIVNRYLNVDNITMKFSLRKKINKLIKSMDGKKILILYNDNTIAVKGIKNKPIDYTFYFLLFDLNFYNNKLLLQGLDNIRDKVLNGNNINWYIRKTNDGYIIPTTEGVLKVNKSIANIIDMELVHKEFVWDNYLWPFVQPLVVSTHK